jgi:hypothetical protein
MCPDRHSADYLQEGRKIEESQNYLYNYPTGFGLENKKLGLSGF